MEECTEKGWETEFYHIAVGCRGFVEKKTISIFRQRFGFTQRKIQRMIKELQEAAEKASFYIWLKRNEEKWGMN